jgi:hypothetical protein
MKPLPASVEIDSHDQPSPDPRIHGCCQAEAVQAVRFGVHPVDLPARCLCLLAHVRKEVGNRKQEGRAGADQGAQGSGNYRSRGAAGHLALDVRNIHGQCVQCNLHKHSNAVEYRIRLVERCGVALVEALECDNEPVKLDRDTLRQIKTIYRAKARDIKKEQE